ncbi:hypothetical protein F4821DRAFT_18756 [Hypoxylon rubiginosum]|uniref:Uncharacterized protein n=1 Tax=Hypoxylon rubiginosum TaxID=110542 RepID=A0ACC0CML1_9PEZI|nr:hypothetical protein F4821DRAFT_18756 [Hypoxylon rubiginosum]
MATGSANGSPVRPSIEAPREHIIHGALNNDDHSVSRSSSRNHRTLSAERLFLPSPISPNGMGNEHLAHQSQYQPLINSSISNESNTDGSTHHPSTTHLHPSEPAAPAESTTTLQGAANATSISLGQPDDEQLWTSFWLRRRTQAGFFILFTCSWIAVVLVMHYNILENGFSLTVSSNRYSWTYGPTVILTIFVSLWRQVDYNCKLHQPWEEMRKGPSTSNRTVLLDYISPIQVTSLSRALSNKHWAVSASILGFLILKGIVVASTTLLVPSITTFSGAFPFTINTKFDAIDYVGTLTQNDLYLGDNNAPSYRMINDTAVTVYQGLSLSKSESPTNIQDGMVFQTFNYTSDNSNLTSLTGSVQAFTPNITCEDASVATINNDLVYGDIAIDSPSCSDTLMWSSFDSGWVDGYKQYQALRVNCSADGTRDDSDGVVIDEETASDLRLLLLATELRDTGEIKDDYTVWDIVRSTAVICKIDYFIQDVAWTKSPTEDSLALKPLHDSGSNYHLPGLSGIQLGEIVFSLVHNPWYLLDGGFDPMFKLMRLSWRSPMEIDFFNASNIKDSFVTAFGGLACQLAQLEFLIPDRTLAEGEILYTENRLHIQLISAWLMIAGFILLSLIAVSMVLTAPRFTHSQDPALLASYGIVLASSQSMQTLLENTGSLRTSELTKWMQNMKFNTAITSDGAFCLEARTQQELLYQTPNTNTPKIETSPKSELELGRTPNDMKVKKGTWVPLFAGMPMVLLTLLLPLFAIVALEILYQQSERNNGIADADNTAVYYVRYPSSIAALLIATLFDSLDFTISAFAPFNSLRSKAVSIKRGLVTNLLEVMPPVALFYALMDQYFGAVLSILAALVGSTLTIIVSGLWVVDPSVIISTEITATATNTWDLSWPNSSYNDAAASEQLPGILANSSSTPPGIWDNLVFPDITDIIMSQEDMADHPKLNMSDPNAQKSLTYSLNLPALRPKLRCEPVTKLDTEINDKDSTRTIRARYPLPHYCRGGPGGNLTYGRMDIELRSDEAWLGYFVDLHMGPWDENNPEYTEIKAGLLDMETSVSTDQPDNPDGCPSIGIIFGRTENEYAPIENLTGLYCFQEIQQVETSILFDYDGSSEKQTTIKFGESNIRSPPLVNESTAVLLTNGTQGIDSFHYRIIEHFADVPTYWISPHDPSNNMYYYDLNSFFMTVAFALDMPPLDAMLGPTNTQVLIDAVERLYQKYMVLVINSPIFRKPLSDSTNQPRQQKQQQQIVGSVSTTVSRHKIDFVSKLILQVFLATMTVLGGLGFLLTNIRGTLPRNPFSIASLMSLFAGSQFCKRNNLPAGAEWMSRRELAKAFRGWRFSLGWWEVPNTTRVLVDDLLETNEGEETLRFGIGIGSPKYRGYARKGDKAE